MTLKIADIVLTDFFCWTPVIILGIHGYPCFQAEPTTMVFVTWFAPVLIFINFHLGIYLNEHTLNLWDKLSRPFAENVEQTLAFPSRWRIIDNRNNLYWCNVTWLSYPLMYLHGVLHSFCPSILLPIHTCIRLRPLLVIVWSHPTLSSQISFAGVQ